MSSEVLLDTHVLVWLTFGDRNLGLKGRALVNDALKDDVVFVSAISFLEIATLRRRGRLRLQNEVATWRQAVLQHGVKEIPVHGDVAIAAGEIQGVPGDPADRIIIATAESVGATLLTADERILAWPGDLPRHDARR